MRFNLKLKATGQFLATFELHDETVISNWDILARDYRTSIETGGIATINGLFFQHDGRAFLDNLLIAFGNSNVIAIEKLD